VPITSDRGLCGGVNGAICKATKFAAADMKGEIGIAILGSKGETQLKRTHSDSIVRVISDIYGKPTAFAQASEIVEELQAAKKHDKVSIIYNKYVSAISYDTCVETMDAADSMEDRLAAMGEKYEFDDEFCETLHINDLMQFCLASKLYSRILESATSEVSARMQAMENATKNCGEMIDKLTIDMNKARQAAITQELSEIVSGAASVAE
jgi:F-type H+-transporting ATPase subunit gamma